MKKRINLERLYLLVSLVYHNFDLDRVAAAHSTQRRAVIYNLRKLEDELGTPLFHRSDWPCSFLGRVKQRAILPRPDRLTPAARRLVSVAAPFFAQLDDLEHRALRDNALSDLTTYSKKVPA